MDLHITRLRRWFGVAAIFCCLVVLGVYFQARHNVQNALKEVPEKLGIQVQQSAQDFTISKSDQGHTLFKLQANKAVQFKGIGRAELHDVTITIYGRDSSRFDQVYGKDFEYDQQSGDVTSKGEVSIDLQANPQGAARPDQAAPRELKNPIHLKTTNLVFNQKTGDAWTPSLVEFYVPQTRGSAVGAKYSAKDSVLTLQSQVHMTVGEGKPLTILAQHAILGKLPRQIVLQHPQTESGQSQGMADEATLFLREDNTLDHAMAAGNVAIDSEGPAPSKAPGASAPVNSGQKSSPTTSHLTAEKLEVAMGMHNQVKSAVFSGDVHLKTEGTQSSESTAGRAVLTFRGRNVLTKVHAEQQVKLLQHSASAKNGQDIAVTAPIIDIFLTAGNRPTRAETTGPPEITLVPPEGKRGTQTRVTADKLIAKFDSLGQLSQIHGVAHARVVTNEPPDNHDAAQAERVSTSDAIDAQFRPGTGIEELLQLGHFTYQGGTQQAFADRARYTPADQILVLSGNPRILDSGMATTARSVRLN